CPLNNSYQNQQGNNVRQISPALLNQLLGEKTYISLKIGNAPRDFLVDTGCQMAIVPVHYLTNQQIRPTSMTITAVNNSPLNIIGQTTLHLRLGSKVFTTPVLVSDAVRDGMLSFSWLKQHCERWDFSNDCLVVGGARIKLFAKPSSMQCGRVY